MPCLWPSPERGRITAASSGSSTWIASPVGMSSRAPARKHQRRLQAGAQIQAGRTIGRVGGQRELPPDARIQDAHLECAPGGSHAGELKRAPCRAGARRCGHSVRAAMSAMSPRARASLPARAEFVARIAGEHDRADCPRSRRPCRAPTSLAAIMSRFFFSSLVRAFCSTASVSAAKPTTKGRSARAATVASMSVRAFHRQLERLAGLLDLCSAARAGR